MRGFSIFFSRFYTTMLKAPSMAVLRFYGRVCVCLCAVHLHTHTLPHADPSDGDLLPARCPDSWQIPERELIISANPVICPLQQPKQRDRASHLHTGDVQQKRAQLGKRGGFLSREVSWNAQIYPIFMRARSASADAQASASFLRACFTKNIRRCTRARILQM